MRLPDRVTFWGEVLGRKLAGSAGNLTLMADQGSNWAGGKEMTGIDTRKHCQDNAPVNLL
jgi:hypothetical protein